MQKFPLRVVQLNEVSYFRLLWHKLKLAIFSRVGSVQIIISPVSVMVTKQSPVGVNRNKHFP